MVERIQTRVKHNGWSYQLNNQIDAVKLENQLKEYEKTIKELKGNLKLQTNINMINKKLDCMHKDMNEIHELLKGVE